MAFSGLACSGGGSLDGPLPPPSEPRDGGVSDAFLDAGEPLDLDGGDAARTETRELTLALRGPSGAVQVFRSAGGTAPEPAEAPLRCEMAESPCRFALPLGTPLRLVPEPGSRARFLAFEGACAGSAACHLTVEADLRVQAVFAPALRTLTVERRGEGEGRVVGAGLASGLDCGVRCEVTLPLGSVVELVASPARGSLAEGFSGACEGPRCRFALEGDARVIAHFALQQVPLVVALAGDGAGSVESAAGDIACPGDCSETLPFGTLRRLEATPATGSRFAGWAGACSGDATTCRLTVEGPTSVSARFERQLFPLRVTAVGRASGSVEVTPAGLPCAPEAPGCSRHPYGDGVSLRAVWDPETTRFDGWEGACAGTARDCALTVSGPLDVAARFSPQPRTLRLLRDGSGGALGQFMVVGGVSCGADCWTFDHGTTATVEAIDTPDARHLGWTGCDRTPGHRMRSCVLDMDRDRSARAAFVRRRLLTVEVQGVGAVGVDGGTASAGVCESTVRSGTTCTIRVDEGADVRLTAVPRQRTWYFNRWSAGPCLPEPRSCLTQLFSDTRSVAVFLELI